MSAAMMLLRQDASHARKIREHETYQARIEGLLRLAAQVLVDGDEGERADVARQIGDVMQQGVEA